MNAEAFVDSNVLLYAVSKAKDERRKASRAVELLQSGDLGFSTQVFSEFYVNATQKRRKTLSHPQAIRFLQTLCRFTILPVSSDLVFAGFDLKQRYQLSYWDALIVAAAQALGCRVLYSEDLQSGQRLGGVVIENPFI